ncbi:MAG: MarR family transcriptional regulator [Planctomycetes bacterium]|nr:MarR family transcriptional regulator [Planctomycetota bacterium]MCB9870653.1 MarR family transcriptional regulator [Planctomycetota bacterium]
MKKATSGVADLSAQLLQAAGRLTHVQSDLLKQFGLTRTQYDALRAVHLGDPQGSPVLDVGSRMTTRVPDITRLADRLERDGFVQRTQSKDDRRVVHIRLKKKAVTLLGKIDRPLAAATKKLLGALSSKEQKVLGDLLQRLAAAE